jgi:hypothetical protein
MEGEIYMPRHNHSIFEILMHTPGEEEPNYPILKNLRFELIADWTNSILDIFEDTMKLSKGKLLVIMKNEDGYYFDFIKLSNTVIGCLFFYVPSIGDVKLLSERNIVLDTFVNKSSKTIIDLYIGQRDISNEMVRLLNEYVDQENIALFSGMPG